MLKKNTLLWFGLIYCFISSISAQEGTANDQENVQNMKLRANIKAFYMPVFSVRTPKGAEISDENKITSDIKNGHGYGLYVGMDVVDKFDSETFNIGFGFILQETKHDSKLDVYHLTSDAILFEVNIFNTFYRSKKLDIIQQFGISGGGILFDFDQNKDSFASGMGAFRYLINFEFYHHWDTDIGGGLFVWGQPGDTLGYGGFFTIEIGCRF